MPEQPDAFDHLLDLPDIKRRMTRLARGVEVGFPLPGGASRERAFTVTAVDGGYKVRRAGKHVGSFADLGVAMAAGVGVASKARA